MQPFAYDVPETESEVLEALSAEPGATAVLAGGTDLIGMMKKMLAMPERVVSLKDVASLKRIDGDSHELRIGAMVTLEEMMESPDLEPFSALRQAIAAISSMQLQAQGTLGGELCQKPRCWYFRSGHGLLADNGRLVEQGDNRYHAILGNAGPAKFVSASRLAPALVALGASLRIIGPNAGDESVIPVEDFFQTPGANQRGQEHFADADSAVDRLRETVLRPNQIVTHVLLSPEVNRRSASYEVQHGSGADYPLAAASAALVLDRGRVAEARVAMGQVAPVPWLSPEAAEVLIGRTVSYELAEEAGRTAVAMATPLAHNGYKVTLARVAVKRAILKAAGLETGGFDLL